MEIESTINELLTQGVTAVTFRREPGKPCLVAGEQIIADHFGGSQITHHCTADTFNGDMLQFQEKVKLCAALKSNIIRLNKN